MTTPATPYTDADAARLAEHLYTYQWRSDPEFPTLHKPSAHREHNYNSDCAICQGDLSRIARAVLSKLANDGRMLPTGERPRPHLDAVKAERDKLVETVGRMISLPPHLVAEAYGVTYTGEVQP